MKLSFTAALVTAVVLVSSVARAEDYVLTIHNNAFSPQEITLPANQKVKLVVKNTDVAPAEFESADLNREKVISANSQITLYVGPLQPGSYKFVNDFHRESTGTIVVK